MRHLLVALALGAVLFPGPVRSETIFGLTNNQIFVFDSATPGTVGPSLAVTGLLPGTSLVGIDFRPATPGQLVGVGQAGGVGSVYEIDIFTGAALLINSGFSLTGTAFGVDFNPVPNALRIVSNADQNLRIVSGGAGTVNTDSSLNPGNPNVVGAAYANNVPGGVGGQTTLYGIDSVTDQLVTQGSVNFPPGVSPNTGTLFTVGALGVDVGELAGFDISRFTGLAFASLLPTGAPGSSLYTIDLSSGTASLVGAIGGGGIAIQGLAVVNIPAPASLVFVAVALAVAVVATRRARPVT